MRTTASATTRIGLAGGLLIVAGVAGGMYWMSFAAGVDAAAGERTSARTAAALVASGISKSLRAGDLADVHLGLRDALNAGGISRCRLLLADGSVIADTARAPSNPDEPLPAQWPERGPDAASPLDEPGTASATISVPGRGLATVVVSPSEGASTRNGRDRFLGGVAVSLALLGAWVAAIRWAGARIRGLGAVRSALMAARDAAGEALLVSDRFGAEAAAWNELVTERERLRTAATLVHAGASVGGGSKGDSANAAALDGLWLGVMLLDGEGRVEYANGAAAVMLRSKRDALVGRELAETVTDPGARGSILEAVKGKRRASAEITTAQENQEQAVLRLTVKPLRRGDVASSMMLIEDVTQQRVADESRNAFVSQATHELRTPLTNMRLYLDTLAEEGDADPAVKARCMNVISGEVRRLERIVGDMLSVSEIEAGSLRILRYDLNVGQLMEEIEADFRAQAEDREIELRFEMPPKVLPARADRDKLTLALHNIIGNALKYTPAGGAVTVRVEQSPADLRVSVIDNGIGIKPDECELIFDRFYRAKDKRLAGITGSGLGLALARQIARLHAGDVSVRSVLDKGSTFTLTVPTGEAGAVAARAA
ncbi:MAG: sensor histidine kinase [Phycisphaerales bacterium]